MVIDSNWDRTNRLAGLRRFAVAISLLNILGHTILGFEQSWAQPLVALVTAYSLEILLEWVDAWVNQRTPGFVGSFGQLVDFLLSAHITGLAIAMLLYANDRLLLIAFATAVAIGSKAIVRAPVGNSTRHFLNPSNLGITITLLLFPWVGIAPPYQFTENLSGIGDWILPGLLIVSGTFLNARFTHRLPLIAAWLGGFAVQALLRSLVFGMPIVAGFVPMTGVAFLLFTFYMVTDPGTTPSKPLNQVIFGASVAAVYGLLMVSHIVFGFFFALTLVCTLRGLVFYAQALATNMARTKVLVPASTVVGEV
ncbi:MAG: RnfABCDGE type electron transport complex subunit D [Symplocastrum torsivum CPER-KK1]|jgi:Na+-translocating ferredoxin:NAD+ oxidoreductase RnfD subunit|uniref:RnfABCDGE type electron transport complex subunit D n=1 Tax=Symplocastrum torsivum CPER-KK1 TaxID=450513 RepID=A0A951UD11_9CYAN|nr:RnfABCDGE type electron transport complex subunit D [Symplocastrum torsivum CPER-KK1]